MILDRVNQWIKSINEQGLDAIARKQGIDAYLDRLIMVSDILIPTPSKLIPQNLSHL
jgi:hypothetical protein